MKEGKKVAVFVTFGSVGNHLDDGTYSVLKNTAYVYQGKLHKQTCNQDIVDKEIMLKVVWEKAIDKIKRERVPFSVVDFVVINCGAIPAVALALALGTFRPPQIIMAHCGCGQLSLCQTGERITRTPYIRVSCGGVDALDRMLRHYLRHGDIVAYMTLAHALKPQGVED